MWPRALSQQGNPHSGVSHRERHRELTGMLGGQGLTGLWHRRPQPLGCCWGAHRGSRLPPVPTGQQGQGWSPAGVSESLALPYLCRPKLVHLVGLWGPAPKGLGLGGGGVFWMPNWGRWAETGHRELAWGCGCGCDADSDQCVGVWAWMQDTGGACVHPTAG